MAATKKTAAKKTATPKDTVTETVAEAVNGFETFWAQGAEKAQEQFEKATASFEEAAAFGRDNAEALMETATLAQKGMEALAAESVTFTQTSFEESVAHAKKALSSTSLQEAIEAQTEFAKTSTEAWLGHMKKMGELFQTSAKEASEPVNVRVTTLMETAFKAAS